MVAHFVVVYAVQFFFLIPGYMNQWMETGMRLWIVELGSCCVVASNSCNSTTKLVLAVCVGVVVLIWLIGCCSVGRLVGWRSA